MTEYLWAPWRMEYIITPKPEGCIFCTKPKENEDRRNLILHRGASCFVIMNYYPYNNGHLMVVPFRHISRLEDMSDEERREMMVLLTECSRILSRSMKPHGMNIGMNLGKTAGAGIDDHLHFHIVPRWEGDTNFMPITAHTKVLPQGLYETWDTLKPLFDKMESQLD